MLALVVRNNATSFAWISGVAGATKAIQAGSPSTALDLGKKPADAAEIGDSTRLRDHRRAWVHDKPLSLPSLTRCACTRRGSGVRCEPRLHVYGTDRAADVRLGHERDPRVGTRVRPGGPRARHMALPHDHGPYDPAPPPTSGEPDGSVPRGPVPPTATRPSQTPTPPCQQIAQWTIDLGSGPGPQDFALVLVAPGDYEERLRPVDWTALVSTTGDPADVRVWWDFEVGAMHAPVLNPTGACYIEGIHFDGIGHYEGDPGAGNAPATLWLINGATGSTVTLVNVKSTSNNEWLKTGAFQCGDVSTVTAYRTEFIMAEGLQPMNLQTSQAWRSMNPAHRSEYTFIDCEATGAERAGRRSRRPRIRSPRPAYMDGRTIHTTPLTTAKYFH